MAGFALGCGREVAVKFRQRLKLWKISTSIFLALCLSQHAIADCVYSVKSYTSFVILDSHTLILKGGPGKDIMLKSFAFFYSSSQVTVLRDSFCDYESSVLYVDGQPVDIQQVKWL